MSLAIATHRIRTFLCFLAVDGYLSDDLSVVFVFCKPTVAHERVQLLRGHVLHLDLMGGGGCGGGYMGRGLDRQGGCMGRGVVWAGGWIGRGVVWTGGWMSRGLYGQGGWMSRGSYVCVCVE